MHTEFIMDSPHRNTHTRYNTNYTYITLHTTLHYSIHHTMHIHNICGTLSINQKSKLVNQNPVYYTILHMHARPHMHTLYCITLHTPYTLHYYYTVHTQIQTHIHTHAVTHTYKHTRVHAHTLHTYHWQAVRVY